MKLIENIRDPGPSIYYSKEFKNMVEDHLEYLINLSDVTIKILPPMISYKYASDLTGLLYHLNIPAYLHYVIMRINRYKNYTDFKGDETHIKIITSTPIVQLTNTLKTRLSKSF